MKSTGFAIMGAGLLVAFAVIFSSVGSSGGGSASTDTAAEANNVSVVAGKQIVQVSVKGGYHPQRSTAKAGVPTILRFTTNSTYDCSSSIRIPSLNIAQALPSSGTTDIDAGTPQAGVLRGTCGMGMYSFEVDIQE